MSGAALSGLSADAPVIPFSQGARVGGMFPECAGHPAQTPSPAQPRESCLLWKGRCFTAGRALRLLVDPGILKLLEAESGLWNVCRRNR